MKKTVEWLIDDIHIFRYHYLMCNLIEKKKYEKGLLRYQGRFENKSQFLKWYLSIVKQSDSNV